MNHLLRDLHYGFRMLLKSPAVSAIAILSLALGIGANATIFTWTRATLMRPLPGVQDADRMVVVMSQLSSGRWISNGYLDFRDLQEHNEVFDGVFAHTMQAVTVRSGDTPERVWAAMVTSNYFDVLGVDMQHGRGFAPSEDAGPGTAPVAILSHKKWLQSFGGDPGVVGRTVDINGVPFDIIGVTAPKFVGTNVGLTMDMWIPVTMQPVITASNFLESRGTQFLEVMGRLKPGMTLGQAQVGLDRFSEQMAIAYPDTFGGSESRTIAMEIIDHPFGGMPILKPMVLALTVLVGLVLLITCANVANLMLARGAGRNKEIALRQALGANRGRITSQLLVESLLLAVIAGWLGIGMAFLSGDLLASFIPPTDLPAGLSVGVDFQVLIFTLGISLLAGILFGLAPALRSRGTDIIATIRDEAGRGSHGRRRGVLRHALVVTQIGLSVMLLIAAGLLMRSLRASRDIDPGFATSHVLLGSLDLTANQLSTDEGSRLLDRLRQRIETVPGVESAAFARTVPLGFIGNSSRGVTIDGYVRAEGEDMGVNYNTGGSRYFETLSIPLVEGRTFRDPPLADEPLELVINETMAKRYWKGSPIGQTVKLSGRDGGIEATVVGVAAAGKYFQIGEADTTYMYLPRNSQFHRPDMVLHVRTPADPMSLAPQIERAVRSVDPGLALFGVRGMREHMEIAVFAQNITATMLSAFGGLALFLAAIGIYGVIAYSVAQRTQEIGIRMALGARRSDVLRMVMRQGLVVTAIGVGLGLVGALAASGLLASLLIGVDSHDPTVFGLVALVLGGLAVLASLLPSYRATRLDPLTCLHYE